MKVYISGKISGMNQSEAEQIFESMEQKTGVSITPTLLTTGYSASYFIRVAQCLSKRI